MKAEQENLVWMDLEMTGLDPSKDRILEIAVLVTDSDLNLLSEGPTFFLSQPETILNNMDDWNTRHHTDSGLLDRVRAEGIKEKEAEVRVLDYLNSYVKEGSSPLCGNSVWQDRRFLEKYMPQLNLFFHYRNIDVSSIKELARRWVPEVARGVKKTGAHRALDDIRESLAELKFYRENFFKLKS